MSSYFQMKCTNSDILPIQNCQWQQIKYCLIYVFSVSPFEMVNLSDEMYRSRYSPHLKLSVTGDQVLVDLCLQWEPIENGDRIRSCFHMKWKTRSTCQMKCTMRSDIPPSIDILWWRAELGHFQMKWTNRTTCQVKCTLRLDIPPKTSDDVYRGQWAFQMKCSHLPVV